MHQEKNTTEEVVSEISGMIVRNIAQMIVFIEYLFLLINFFKIDLGKTSSWLGNCILLPSLLFLDSLQKAKDQNEVD